MVPSPSEPGSPAGPPNRRTDRSVPPGIGPWSPTPLTQQLLVATAPAAEIEFFPVPRRSARGYLDLGRLVLRRWGLDDMDEQAAVVARSVAHLTPFMGWAAEADQER